MVLAWLVKNPLFVLFLVTGLGYIIGRVKLAGFSFGISAVLFAGLAVGALHPDVKIPSFVYLMGLVIFIYAVGISGGPRFFSELKKTGLRDNLVVMGALVVAAGLAHLAQQLLELNAELVAGLFCGSLTNTPAVSAVVQAAASAGSTKGTALVGFSVAYPMGVIGMVVAVYVLQRWWGIDYAAERQQLQQAGLLSERLIHTTIRVDEGGQTLAQLIDEHGWNVVFDRFKRGESVRLPPKQEPLEAGDLLGVVGNADEVQRVTLLLGSPSEEHLELDRRVLDFRRIFVSSPAVAGRRIGQLHLGSSVGAIITHVRRGDGDKLANGRTKLELGDRVRVVAPREEMTGVNRIFGDSYRAISEVDVVSLSLGIAVGMLIGQIPIPWIGGQSLRLGWAGGPLVVGLVLGYLGRTGPLVWQLPYSANRTLRQLGLMLFLAGLGTQRGYAFRQVLVQEGRISLFLVGALITCATALITLWVAHRLLKIPMSIATGVLAGLQTQPALLAFALEQADNDSPNVGFATVYPVATVCKIMLAQLLLFAG